MFSIRAILLLALCHSACVWSLPNPTLRSAEACASDGALNRNKDHPGKSINDKQLKALSEELLKLDENSVSSAIQLNLQNHLTDCSKDKAPERLFKHVDEEAVLAKKTFKSFIALLDNYEVNVRQPEDVTGEEKQEQEQFLQDIMETPVIQSLFNFLHSKNVFSGSKKDFKTRIQHLWFDLYDRDGTSKDVLGSSGFEHVFIGETRKKTVLGFHNWYSFYQREKKGQIDYFGHKKIANFGTSQGISMTFTWGGAKKCVGSIIAGISPELELALYTLCFEVRRNAKCRLTLNGSAISITTYDIQYKGQTYIGTSYGDW